MTIQAFCRAWSYKAKSKICHPNVRPEKLDKILREEILHLLRATVKEYILTFLTGAVIVAK